MYDGAEVLRKPVFGSLSDRIGPRPVLLGIGAAHGYGPLATGIAVSVLAATAALVQPWAGKAHDAEAIPARVGMAGGPALCAAGFIAAAIVPTMAGILTAAVAVASVPG